MKHLKLTVTLIFLLLILSVSLATGISSEVENKVNWKQKLGPRVKEIVEGYQQRSEPSLFSSKKEEYREVPVIVERGSKAQLSNYGTIKLDFSIISASALRVPVPKLKAMAKDSEVHEISYDHLVRALREESMPMIRADVARSNYDLNGSDINISVVDTGIYNHTEFKTPNRIIEEKCYCEECCPDGSNESDNATDDEGHGTHCAGIAAGEGGQGNGSGVARDANLFAVKVLNSGGGGYASDIISGIEWSVKNDANIISLSLGMNYSQFDKCYGPKTSGISTAVDNATKQGSLVVVSAGNEGELGNERIGAPGCAKRALTVGSVNDKGISDSDLISSFSSRGRTKDGRIKPDLMAPGAVITSTLNNLLAYGNLSGTSMSAPHVSGVAALLYEKYRKQHNQLPDPDWAKTVLMTAVNTSGMRQDGFYRRNNWYGSGRIDAEKAISIINYTSSGNVGQGETDHLQLNISSDQAITTLYWPEDENTANRLDLILSNSTHNITYAANANDSVEQIHLFDLNSAQGGIWDIYINGTNVSGSQDYYLASDQEFGLNLAVKSPKNKTYSENKINFNLTSFSALTSANFSVDNNPNASMANSTKYHYYNITYPSLTEGDHSVTFYARSTTGVSAATSKSFTIDTQPPQIELLSPSNSTNTTNESISFKSKAEDKISSELNCSLIIDGSLNQTNNSVYNATNTTFSTSLTDGNYWWWVNCSDQANNSNSSETRHLTRDSTAPYLSILSPKNKTYYSEKILINLSSQDQLTEVDSVWFTNHSENVTYDGSQTYNFSHGSQTLQAYVNDSLGNLNSTQVSFTVDLKSPVLDIISPKASSEKIYTTEQIWFNLSLNEKGNSSLYSIDNGANQSLRQLNDTYFYNLTTINQGGQHNVTFYANNSSGYWGQTSSNFTLDLSSPQIELLSPVNSTNTTNHTINFSFKAEDKVASELNCSLIIDEKADQSNGSVKNGTNTIFSASLADEEYRWWVNCSDEANHTNSSLTRDLKRDSTPPLLTITSPENKSYGQEEIWVNLSSQDELSQVAETWFNNDSHNVTFTGNATHNFSHGSHTLQAYVNDSLGNLNRSEVSFNIDSRPPRLDVISPLPSSDKTYSSTSLWFNLSVNKRINASWFSLDQQDNVSLVGKNKTYYYNQTTVSEGTHNVTFYANDSWGHLNSTSFSFEVSLPEDGGDDEDDSTTSSPTIVSTTSNTVMKESNQTTSWSYISAKREGKMMINHSQLALTKIEIGVNQTVRDVQITVSRQKERPKDIKNLTATVYRYSRLESNLEGKKLQQATIGFSINKSWLEREEINASSVRLYRFSQTKDSWQKLPTTLLYNYSSQLVYQATTNNFSYFAIAGDKKRKQSCPYPCCSEDRKFLDKTCAPYQQCINHSCVRIECPSCPEPTDWLNCTLGTKVRMNYRCSNETNFICQSYQETKLCEVKEIPGTNSSKQILLITALASLALIFILLATHYSQRVKQWPKTTENKAS